MSKPATEPHKPAFPVPTETYADGLTKRECFAAMAMQGLCASDAFAGHDEHKVAEIAINQADALIAALNKETA